VAQCLCEEVMLPQEPLQAALLLSKEEILKVAEEER
jgi:hypothetical protein